MVRSQGMHRFVYDDIASDFIIDGNWRIYADLFRIKIVIKETGAIILMVKITDIKIGNRLNLE